MCVWVRNTLFQLVARRGIWHWSWLRESWLNKFRLTWFCLIFKSIETGKPSYVCRTIPNLIRSDHLGSARQRNHRCSRQRWQPSKLVFITKFPRQRPNSPSLDLRDSLTLQETKDELFSSLLSYYFFFVSFLFWKKKGGVISPEIALFIGYETEKLDRLVSTPRGLNPTTPPQAPSSTTSLQKPPPSSISPHRPWQSGSLNDPAVAGPWEEQERPGGRCAPLCSIPIRQHPPSLPARTLAVGCRQTHIYNCRGNASP